MRKHGSKQYGALVECESNSCFLDNAELVKIRLARHGAKKRPYYRIVVADSRARRDGRFIEEVGRYNPCVTPSFVSFKQDRLEYWLGVGAQPTDTVARLIKNAQESE